MQVAFWHVWHLGLQQQVAQLGEVQEPVGEGAVPEFPAPDMSYQTVVDSAWWQLVTVPQW